jgi:hypothetical protein
MVSGSKVLHSGIYLRVWPDFISYHSSLDESSSARSVGRMHCHSLVVSVTDAYDSVQKLIEALINDRMQD